MTDIRGIRASDVTGDVPAKFWPDVNEPILYCKSVNLTAGPSGVGKSLITVRQAADISMTVGPVIYGNLEDDLAVQRDRLAAAGADMDKVWLASFTIPDNLPQLEQAILRLGAKLVIFDTAEKHINAPIQRWAKPLAALREVLARTDCASMFVHHTLKNVKKNADWRAAIGGATAGLTGTARHIALVGPRPDNPTQVVYCPVKDSNDATPRAIAYDFATEDFDQSDGRTVSVAFMEEAEKGITIANPTVLVHVAGDNDSSSGPKPEKLEEAAEFLRLHLAMGPRPVEDCYVCVTHPDGTDKAGLALIDPRDPSRICGHKSRKAVEKAGELCPDCGGQVRGVDGLKTEAKMRDINFGTIKRAKDALTIEVARKGFGPGSFVYWRLPDGHPALANNVKDFLP